MDESKISRRGFFKRTGKAAVGSLTAAAFIPIIMKEKKAKKQVLLNGTKNEVIQMQNDIVDSLQKPIEKRKWAMLIDTRKCIGCSACTVACIAENNLPPGVMYRNVIEIEDGSYPDVKRYFMPSNCMQCEKPACVSAANKITEGAMAIRADGIVTMDYSKMKGDKMFEAVKKACPYKYALYLDEGKNYTDGTPLLQEYEKREVSEYGKIYSRKSLKNTIRKCHFCLHKIENGMLPACVSTCVGRAMYFGDLKNPENLVSKYLKANNSFVLNEGAKTSPSVKFIDDNLDETCLKCH